ncbi:hypothetical protein Tco_0168057 [Tanacetum coccineum]
MFIANIHSFKNESKEKEKKYIENEIDLEKKIKELDNIIFKVGQSAQTVHMLTNPQAFYDNIHKQALGYQNPFYLKKAQRIKPTLYDGIVIFAKHVVMPDPEAIKQNISHKPIDYEKLNRLSDDFGKRFTPQQELSGEQAFWLRMSNPTSKPSDASPVKIEAPNELPKSERPRFSKQRFASQVDVNNDLSKPVTTHYLPKEIETAIVKPYHMIAPSSSRYSSNDMVHNHYLEEAKKKIQENGRNSEPSVMPSARSQSTTNGSNPTPSINNQKSRNWPASKSSCPGQEAVPIA